MDFSALGITVYPVITVVCYGIGELMKVTKLDNKWIPVICGTCGLAFGIFSMHFVPNFPATDYLSAAAVGIVSGLAATGANQVIKQITDKS